MSSSTIIWDFNRHVSFHGTNENGATQILTNGVSVTLGGGELGLGFYTGNLLHAAKAWAFHRQEGKPGKVVIVSTKNEKKMCLDFVYFDFHEATRLRKEIKKKNETHKYLLHRDLVISPIVGKVIPDSEQSKWESKTSEDLLNSSDTSKCLI